MLRAVHRQVAVMRRTPLARMMATSYPEYEVLHFPALSPTMETGQLVEWLKAEGDELLPGDVYMTIKTDKADMEAETQQEGYLAKILVPAGPEEIKIQDPIGIVVEEEEDVAAFADFSVADLPAAMQTKQSAAPEPAPAAAPEPEAPSKPAPTPAAPAAAPVAAEAPAPAAPAAAPAAPAATTAAAATDGDDAYVPRSGWGRSLSKSPMAGGVVAAHEAYVATFGTTGTEGCFPKVADEDA